MITSTTPTAATDPLFTPTTLGGLSLKNRIVLAPMTRSRADAHGVAAPFAPRYYAQRAQAGLLITEATQVSFEGMGYSRTPGIHTAEQIAAWSRVTEAAHAMGGTIVLQIFHVGRIAHTANRGVSADVVAPSAILAPGEMWTDTEGMQPHSLPRALGTDEVARIAQDFATAAANAIAAGFDGVEVHAANGYLLHQFLSSNANQRVDRYGGSVENRIRMPLEVLDAVLARVPSDRVGIRISPANRFNDIDEGDSPALYGALLPELDARALAYLHVMRPFANQSDFDYVALARERFRGRLIACGGYDGPSGAALVANNGADAVAFGQAFIANPDLPLRLKLGGPLAEANRDSFYSPGEAGYVDYPFWTSGA